MNRTAFALLLLPLLWSLDTIGDEPNVAQLQEQVRQLQAEVDKLSAVIEGTAKPINLGRTDFAAVSASSSNGGRTPANKFYGIRNAFDGGENWHNDINYSYWLSAGGQSIYVEVRFDHPVTVTSILLDGGPECSPVFTFHKGGEEPHGAFSGEFKPERPLHGVTGVKLSFANQVANIQVNEIHVMGYPHPDVKYKVTRPRLILDERAAQAMAVDAFGQAGFPPYQAHPRVVEEMDCWEFTFRHRDEEVDLFRVTVYKQDSRVETKRLAKWVPIEERGED